MTILVTGYAGFIGSNFTEHMLKQGEDILGIDNFDPFYSKKIKKRNIESFKNHQNFSYVNIDLRNIRDLKQVFANFEIDKVVHLAAKASVRTSLLIPTQYTDSNIASTINLLELSKQNNVHQFIFGSSSSVYGNDCIPPFEETQAAVEPLNPYAASKRSAELFCYSYSKNHNLDCSILRFFTVYGPKQRPDMGINKFTKFIDRGKELTLFGDGTSSRDYTYISDIVSGIELSLKKVFNYEIFNLGNKSSTSLNRLIELIENELGKSAISKHIDKQAGDMEKTLADISKSRKLLNYDPKISIEDGIKFYIDWYKGISL